ncbi:MAG: hypothetical protein PHY92_00555 [Alphaproteobacteria bacterium]|nr:hypothetical protein [Alphaproteobacteria bacterium]
MAAHQINGFRVCAGAHQGPRPHHEDRSFYVPGNLKNSREAKLFLSECFSKAADQTKNYESGTTASVAVFTPDGHLTVAHVGDSPVMLFERNKQTEEIRGFDWAAPHNLANPDECKRLDELINPESRALTRDLGARNWRLAHTPEIKIFDLNALDRKNNDYFLCIGSDGVHRKGMETAEAHARHNLGDRFGTVEYICDRMLTMKGASDNATAIVVKIPEHIKSGLALGVCDGHNGSGNAAEYVNNYFAQSLISTPDFRPEVKNIKNGATPASLTTMISDAMVQPKGFWYEPTSKSTGMGQNGNEVAMFGGELRQLRQMKTLLREQGIKSAIEDGSSGFSRGLRIRSGSMQAFKKLMDALATGESNANSSRRPPQASPYLSPGFGGNVPHGKNLRRLKF